MGGLNEVMDAVDKEWKRGHRKQEAEGGGKACAGK